MRPLTDTDSPRLLPVSHFCTVSRGIATGDNAFFCFSREKAAAYHIPDRCLMKCVCRSADVTTPVLTGTAFEDLSANGRTVYVLDAGAGDYDAIEAYLKTGVQNGVDRKYLPSRRNPWYSMEQKGIAPIWVSSACRKGMKVVRNLAAVQSLTTFHSVYVRPEYAENTNLIFCYFLTPLAQSLVRENRKELGNGLKKFQPNDWNTARMLDIRMISAADRVKISVLYDAMTARFSDAYVEELEEIFASYLK